MSFASPRLPSILIELLLMLAVSEGSVSFAAEWTETRVVGPFVCHADFSLQNYGHLLCELSQLQNDLGRALGISPPREAIEVYLFHDKPTYDRYLKRYYPQVPFRRAVYIKDAATARVFAFLSTQFETDLRHECTHALLHASIRNIPLWLDEGVASYFELPATQRVSNNPYLKYVRWNAWLGIVPQLEDLEKCTNLTKMGKTEYRNSWAWVHFMLNGPPDARVELVRYLRDLDGPTPIEPLSQRLQRRIALLRESFARHFKNQKWEKQLNYCVLHNYQ
ncbi:MAG: hypothetical protein ACWGMZ_08205 [Thermoguttaceae bacterium]